MRINDRHKSGDGGWLSSLAAASALYSCAHADVLMGGIGARRVSYGERAWRRGYASLGKQQLRRQALLLCSHRNSRLLCARNSCHRSEQDQSFCEIVLLVG